MKAVKTTTRKKMAAGGAADGDCWPGKPGCGYKKAQRKNARRKFWNSDAGKTIKKVGAGVVGAGAAVGAYAKNAFGVKDKVKDLMGQKKGGTVKSLITKKTGGTVATKKKTTVARKR